MIGDGRSLGMLQGSSSSSTETGPWTGSSLWRTLAESRAPGGMWKKGKPCVGFSEMVRAEAIGAHNPCIRFISKCASSWRIVNCRSLSPWGWSRGCIYLGRRTEDRTLEESWEHTGENVWNDIILSRDNDVRRELFQTFGM